MKNDIFEMYTFLFILEKKSWIKAKLTIKKAHYDQKLKTKSQQTEAHFRKETFPYSKIHQSLRDHKRSIAIGYRTDFIQKHLKLQMENN